MSFTNLFDITGKTALVTGGSRGLGLALAQGLAEHGVNVALVARDENGLQKAKGQIESRTSARCHTFAFDLSDTPGVEGFFNGVVHGVGPVDILVNAAGINLRGPAEDVTPETWQQVLQINLTATFALSQAFCRHRKAMQRGGKIINIGSLMCHAARPSVAPYTASKGGILMLTKALAVEWAKYNIHVNAIGPGYFDTDMTKHFQADEKFNGWVLGNTPLGRWGQPTDLVGTLIFLSSAASDFITGQIVFVDGGWVANL